MKYRNLEDLEKAIAYAAREGFRDTPRRLLFRAKRMVARLKHIEMLRKEVMEMNHVSFHINRISMFVLWKQPFCCTIL